MNILLTKLALDSHLINYIDHETPRVYFICGYADIEDVQKFAELIVQECAKVSERTGALNEADYEGEMIADAIREHFGVSE